MPMSSSAVVNRAEVLEVVDRLEQALPAAFTAQQALVAEREAVVARAADEAAEIVAAAQLERDRLVGEADVVEVARQEAEALRRETDEYVDERLATFEVTLTKTLEAVVRGRARLHGRSHFDALGEAASADAVPRTDGSDQPG